MKHYHLTLIAGAVMLAFSANAQTTTAMGGPAKAVAGECYAKVVSPAKFDTKSERVVSVPASKRVELVPATYKTISEQVLVSPEYKRSLPVPATYKNVSEQVLVVPEGNRAEPIPGTFKTTSEQVVAKPESLRYEPIAIPLKRITEQAVLRGASSRLETTPATFKTVTERVVVKEASKRLVEVPAIYETVTERVKVADASTVWKRGRAYLGEAKEVRPVKGFNLDAKGQPVSAKSGEYTTSNNSSLDDDVMCLVEVPERFETITRKVVKTPASVREVEIPAEYGTVSSQVVDKAASSREIAIPETMQTVSRTVIDIDAMKTRGYKFNTAGDLSEKPSGEKILRASEVAKLTGGSAAGKAAGDKTDGAESGAEGYVREVKIPAVYTTVSRQVIDKPASTREIETPATFKMVSSRVEDTPALTTEEVIAATYRNTSRQVVDVAANTREVEIAAQYQTLSQSVKVSDATEQWRSILCETNATPTKIIEIQQALSKAGYNPGPMDGVIRSQTMSAVNSYQTAKGLPVDAYLNLETAKSLGVSPR